MPLAAAALAAGAAWGFVMALLAWRWQGSEVVLAQGWFFGAAWAFGALAGRPRLGALAGLAFVAGAVYGYEVLPMWGFEAWARREGADPFEINAIVQRFDADDIALVTTLLIGGLIGFGGALARSRPQPPPDLPPPAPEEFTPPPPERPEPLWAAGVPEPWAAPEVPAPPPADDNPPPPPPAAPDRAPSILRAVAGGLLLAGLATDFFLDRLFDLYSGAQLGVAIVFLVAGLIGAAWLARRYVLSAALAGVLLAIAFGAVQNAEYDSRAHPEIVIIR